MKRPFSEVEQIENKYLKKCLTFLAIKEMLIKTRLRFYVMPTNAGKNAWKKEHLYYNIKFKFTLLVRMSLLWKSVWMFFQKVNHAIPLLDKYPKE
jgi:hypothetical protein